MLGKQKDYQVQWDQRLPKAFLPPLQKESSEVTPQGQEVQHHSLTGTADGWADLRYLWQWGFSNSHSQNYGKKDLKWPSFSKKKTGTETVMHPVFLFMSPEGPAY